MIGLSYQLSTPLKDSLQKIEHFRRQILLAPLPPKTELRLRWEAMVQRLYWSLALADNPLSRNDMVKILTTHASKRLTSSQQDAVRYKKALDYISQEWLVSPKTVTAKTVLLLHDVACSGSFQGSEANINRFLDYLQINPENPVILSAIAQMQLISIAPFTDGNGRTAQLLGLLFLYKYGYDFRGLLNLEEGWRRDLKTFNAQSVAFSKTSILTDWLEYFAKTFETQVEKAAQIVASPRFDISLSASFWELNDRQKEILTLLEEPNGTISNKKVQKIFKISQITASRDLAKLATLGLLFPHGRGRSVFYTRV